MNQMRARPRKRARLGSTREETRYRGEALPMASPATSPIPRTSGQTLRQRVTAASSARTRTASPGAIKPSHGDPSDEGWTISEERKVKSGRESPELNESWRVE